MLSNRLSPRRSILVNLVSVTCRHTQFSAVLFDHICPSFLWSTSFTQSMNMSTWISVVARWTGLKGKLVARRSATQFLFLSTSPALKFSVPCSLASRTSAFVFFFAGVESVLEVSFIGISRSNEAAKRYQGRFCARSLQVHC